MGPLADPDSAPNAQEKDWVRRVQEGDLQAYRFLVESYQSRIYRLVARILGPGHGDIEDVVQEVFVKAYLSLKGFKGSSSFGTWITRIAVNRARDLLRKRSRRVSLDDVQAQELKEYLRQAGSEEGSGTRAEAIGRLVTLAVASLPQRLRIVITLKDIEGLSYEEVSGLLNRSVGTVKSRHSRARARLRKLLSPSIAELMKR
jgi:RNA polymerase sigma-70 factor (ECF subfamily)